MYHTFYGLVESPFSLTPDPRYLYLTEAHKEALASVRYGIEERKGFVLVLGEVGTGKTTLIRHLLGRLGSNVHAVFLFNTAVTYDELLEAILRDLEVPSRGRRRVDMIEALNEYLLAQARAGRSVVVIIDEAQHLSETVLEHLRLLSNLETARGKLLQIILVGQPELGEKLALPELRQLRQRIGLVAELRPLAYGETVDYIAHRLRVAGRRAGGSLLTRSARRAVHRASQGIPRLINVICDKALVLAYASGARRVSRRFIRQVVRDWSVFRRTPRSAARHSAARGRRRHSSLPRRAVAAAAVLAVMAVGLVAAAPSIGDWWNGARTAWIGRRLPPQAGQATRSVTAPIDPPAPAVGTATVPNPRAGAAAHAAPELVTAPEPVSEPVEEGWPAQGASGPATLEAPPASAVTVPPGTTRSPSPRPESGRVESTIVDVARKTNPELTDINRLAEGQVLWLPSLASASMTRDDAETGYAVHMATVSRAEGPDFERWLSSLDLGGLTVRLVAVRPADAPETRYRIVVGPFATADAAEAFYRRSASPPDTLTAFWR